MCALRAKSLSFGKIVSKILVSSLLLGWVAACSNIPDPEEYRFEEPSPFYLYLPESYTPGSSLPLFIGVHGSSTDGRNCWNTWQPYADQYGFVLLCPVLADPDGRLHQLHGNDRLLAILGQVYSGYSIKPEIFLFGFSAGGQFVHGYAFMNPNYVAGVSVIAPGNAYPPPTETRHIPFLIIVGARDQAGNQQVARQLATQLNQTGYSVQLMVLDGMGHAISEEAIQDTLNLYEQVVQDP
jgi:poly(3-hydroxybutyrate) depolymerase